MTSLLLFLNNLETPLMVVTIVVAFGCAIIGIWSFIIRENAGSASREHINAHFRIRTCLYAGIGVVVAYLIVASLPEAEYDVRTVEKIVEVPVEKIVEKKVYSGVKEVRIPPTYSHFYNECALSLGVNLNDNDHSTYLTGTGREGCHKQSVEAVKVSSIDQTKIEKYNEIFQWCNERYSLDDTPDSIVAQRRNERLGICHNAAKEALEAAS